MKSEKQQILAGEERMWAGISQETSGEGRQCDLELETCEEVSGNFEIQYIFLICLKVHRATTNTHTPSAQKVV